MYSACSNGKSEEDFCFDEASVQRRRHGDNENG